MIPSPLATLMQPPPGLDVDFRHPSGAEALVPFDGVSWKIFSNPLALFIGGVAAVILELAEPSVRSGVWDHSSFRKNPVKRMRRTGFAALTTVYAPRAAAEAMIAKVVVMHERVKGTTPSGLSYHANDPRLLTWVHATALWGIAAAYDKYVHALSASQKDLAFAEGQVAARLYGADASPTAWAEWESLLSRTVLEDSPVLTEFLDLMEHSEILPQPMRPLQRMLVRAAVDLTPQDVRRHLPSLDGRGLKSGQGLIVKALGNAVERLALPELPPAQAQQRMQG